MSKVAERSRRMRILMWPELAATAAAVGERGKSNKKLWPERELLYGVSRDIYKPCGYVVM